MSKKIKRKRIKHTTKQFPTKRELLKRSDLSLEEKIKIYQAFCKHDKKASTSVQETFRFKKMSKNGICQIDDTHFSTEISYTDINYDKEDVQRQVRLMHGWQEIFHALPSGVKGQLFFMNYFDTSKKNWVMIPEKDDAYNDIRKEYQQIYRDLLMQRNGLTKERSIVLTINQPNEEQAKEKLEAITYSVMQSLKDIGSTPKVLDGEERIFQMKKLFAYNRQLPSSMVFDEDVKDYISPKQLHFLEKYIKIGNKKWGSAFTVNIIASELNDRFLTELLNLECEQFLSIHFEKMEHDKAIQMLKGKLGDVNAMKITSQQTAVQEGYDMDIIPSDINKNVRASELLIEKLETNQDYFHVTITMMLFAPKKKELDQLIESATALIKKRSCSNTVLKKQQEQALISVLPIGCNELSHYWRGMTTDLLSMLIPFTTIQIFQKIGQYYGLNQMDGSIIRASRKLLPNPNGLILGPPGTGKSFSSKEEWIEVFFTTTDDIILIDPEGENTAIVNALGGQVIRLGPNSNNHLNMMDIDMFYLETDGEKDEDTPLNTKRNFLLTLFESILHRQLTSIEESILDRCVGFVYEPFVNRLDIPLNEMPRLEDLYHIIKKQPEQEAQQLALSIEIYVHGSLNTYNRHTNVEINNRLVCFDISALTERMRATMLAIIQEQIWNRVKSNKRKGKYTWYYVDEFQVLLSDEHQAAYNNDIWKRFRKYWGIPTGMTQNVSLFLNSPLIESILENSSFIRMLSQGAKEREILANRLHISEEKQEYITNAKQGSGLIFYNGLIIPFKDKMPENTKLYQLLSTKAGEVHHGK